MNRRLMCIALFAVALTGCHIKPPAEPPIAASSVSESPLEAVAPPPQEDLNADKVQAANQDVVNSVPPCLPEFSKPRIVKRKPRAAQETQKLVAAEARPARAGPEDPEVKPIEGSVSSILGKKVEGSGGEDLGRVVDVQADGKGRVRLVIIEFGGFLGVGNRRTAVDWGLLRFHPDDPDRPLSLAVSGKQIQSTPEYRQALHPLVLMAPAPMAAPQTDAAPSQNK